MSSLIFVGLFSLRAGRHVHTSFTRRTGDKGNICHAHYKTAVACRHPPDLPAEIRIYSRGSDPLLADETLAIVIAKGYVPPGDVAGDLLLDTLYIAPFPRNSDEDTAGYNRKLPDFHWPLLFGLGTVSGSSSELLNGQVSFPVSTSECVRGSPMSSTLLCVHYFFFFFFLFNKS